MKAYLSSIVAALLGTADEKIRLLAVKLQQSALDSLTSATTRQKLSGLFAGAFNDSVRLATQKLVSGAFQPTIDSLVMGIHTAVVDNLPIVQRKASLFLAALGLISVAIIGYVWYQRRRYGRLVELLTFHINKMPM